MTGLIAAFLQQAGGNREAQRFIIASARQKLARVSHRIHPENQGLPSGRVYLLRSLLAALCLCGTLLVPRAAAANTISPLGLWLSHDHQGVIAITSCGAGLCGHIAGVTLAHPTDPPPVDWRGQPLCGDPMIAASPVAGKPDQWHGKVTDPRDGSAWPATLTLANGKLRLHGYFAIPLLGETETWTRYNGPISAKCGFQAAARPESPAPPGTARYKPG